MRGSQNSFSSPNKVVETRKYPETGLQHPFNKDSNFLSRFHVNFRGCYNYGQTDHFSTKMCPAAARGDFDRQTFFAVIWARKPHTKKSARE